jgi:hypothetical protein
MTRRTHDGRGCNAAGRGAVGDHRCGEGLFAAGRDRQGRGHFSGAPRRLTIHELLPLSPLMVIRWRGEGAAPASARPLKPLGSAFVASMAATVLGRKPKPGESNGWGCGGRLSRSRRLNARRRRGRRHLRRRLRRSVGRRGNPSPGRQSSRLAPSRPIRSSPLFRGPAGRGPEFLFSGRASQLRIPRASWRSGCPWERRHRHRAFGRRYSPEPPATGTASRSASIWRDISTPGA